MISWETHECVYVLLKKLKNNFHRPNASRVVSLKLNHSLIQKRYTKHEKKCEMIIGSISFSLFALIDAPITCTGQKLTIFEFWNDFFYSSVSLCWVLLLILSFFIFNPLFVASFHLIIMILLLLTHSFMILTWVLMFFFVFLSYKSVKNWVERRIFFGILNVKCSQSLNVLDWP